MSEEESRGRCKRINQKQQQQEKRGWRSKEAGPAEINQSLFIKKGGLGREGGRDRENNIPG